MRERIVSKRRLLWAVLMIAALAIVMASAVPASAGPINPDLTAFGLDVSWDGTDFFAYNFEIPMSWTNPDGTAGGSDYGDIIISWGPTFGSFLEVWIPSGSPLLSGVVTSFTAAPDGFYGTAALSLTGLGMGDQVRFIVDMDPTSTIHLADIYPDAVPEDPATLGLLGLGLGAIAARRRRARR